MTNIIIKHPALLANLLLKYWQHMQTSFWFIPSLIVVGAVSLASLLIAIDSGVEMPNVEQWRLLFGASASGSRDLLSAVATSMITISGVVFSITLVALSLTSSQYTSRVLRNFMGDRVNQSVLGVFLGIFAYCLVVLRVIRGGDEGVFIPSLAVLVALLLAFVGIGYLIFFIHHIAVSIQASSIIAAAAKETIAAIDNLFPQELGRDTVEGKYEEVIAIDSEYQWKAILSKKTGYLVSIDTNSLLVLCEQNRIIVRMERGVGEFIVEATPILSIAEPNDVGAEKIEQLLAAYEIGHHRIVSQDAGFGVRQIVDIALKALSPGVNDTTTAVMCIDYLKAILVRLAMRNIPTQLRIKNNTLCIIARGPSFQDLLSESFDQIRQSATGNTTVILHMLQALEVLAGVTQHPQRKAQLIQKAALIVEIAEGTVPAPYDRGRVSEAMARFSRAN